MRKILTGLISYVVISSIICLLVGMFAFPVPAVNPSDVMAYKFNNGMLFMLVALPSAAITGLLLGCAISFGDFKASLTSRFSPALVGAFKIVLITGVALTFALSLVHDVAVPIYERRKIEYEEKPAMIEQYLTLSHNYLLKSLKNSEYANLATFYAKKVLELDPKNEDAAVLSKRAELAGAVKTRKDNAERNKSDDYYIAPKSDINGGAEIVDSSEINRIHSSSVYDLVLEAEKLFDAGDYLGCHYYAQMAVKVSDTTDVNLSRARELANRSWNILSEAQKEPLTEENRFFRKKVEGYSKLMNGDYLSAYYIFQTLSNQKLTYSRDADVKRYLNIARYELTQEYFFIDETTDKDSFESAENVYFSLHHNDGTYEIFFIKGITDINEVGNMVRYLREVHVYSFDSYGDFVKSMVVPYAKMLAIDANTVSAERKKTLGIDPGWKVIPYLLLCSVDRDLEDVRITPSYLTDDGKKTEGANQMILSMPYDDFGIISKCTEGIQKMDFWHMSKMKRSADSYGYSNEIIMQTVLLSVFYPFMIMFLLLLTAVIAWNYRLQSTKLFKFVWVFSLPFVHVILYGVVGFCEFSVKLFNFIFMGIAGVNYAVYLGLAFYMICIVVMSFVFLSRKGD